MSSSTNVERVILDNSPLSTRKLLEKIIDDLHNKKLPKEDLSAFIKKTTKMLKSPPVLKASDDDLDECLRILHAHISKGCSCKNYVKCIIDKLQEKNGGAYPDWQEFWTPLSVVVSTLLGAISFMISDRAIGSDNEKIKKYIKWVIASLAVIFLITAVVTKLYFRRTYPVEGGSENGVMIMMTILIITIILFLSIRLTTKRHIFHPYFEHTRLR